MAQPATRAEFTDYCLRKLGAPVLEINVDDNQVDDLIDDAIQLYQEYHFDGVEKMFLKHCITDDDVTRFTSSDQNTIGSDDTPAPVAENTWIERDNFLQIPDHVIGISKVFGVSSGLSDNEMWGFANQYFLMDVFSFSSGYTFGNFDMSYFYMIKQWFETLDMVVNTGNLVQYRFNRKQDRLYIDIDPDRIKANQYLLISYKSPVSGKKIKSPSLGLDSTSKFLRRKDSFSHLRTDIVNVISSVTLKPNLLINSD